MTQIYIGPSGRLYQLEPQSNERGCHGCELKGTVTADGNRNPDCESAPCKGKILRPLSDGAKNALRQALNGDGNAMGGSDD